MFQQLPTTRRAAPPRPAAATSRHVVQHRLGQGGRVLRGACACGGHCPRCRGGHDAAAGLPVSRPGDAREAEADRIATRVAAGEAGPFVVGTAHGVQRSAVAHPPRQAAAAVPAGGGRALPADTRRDMEARFGTSFEHVRIHADGAAAAQAARLQARAYTSGSHIVFGAGEFRPQGSAGERLLAHELVHVLQQQRGGVTEIQRAPTISLLEEGFVGPPSATQRRAARSCPISCCLSPLGTLHAMPLFHHASRGATVAAGSAAATGIGAALHFVAADTQPAAGDRCHCDDFRIIQVLETTHPAAGRGGNSYVDNAGTNTPFYGDVGLTGRGEHAIPAGYTDAGERLQTTESIYDRPYRDLGELGTTSLSWRAEACVACIKNGAPDLVLGCATYGFDRPYDAATASFGTVTGVGPDCRWRPSDHFVDTLRGDPTTSSYSFEPAPTLGQCFDVGDFPTPSRETMYA